jgi:hypothetical protein
MSPRSRKVGGLDDPIWTGPGPAEGTSDRQAEPTGARDQRSGRGPQASSGPKTRSDPSRSGEGDTGGKRNGRPARTRLDIPRRILTDDPGTARDDERECEVEGWFQTDDGVPVSSAFRPLGVACARPLGHSGHHRSAPRRARLRPGRVWVYQWGDPERPEDD